MKFVSTTGILIDPAQDLNDAVRRRYDLDSASAAETEEIIQKMIHNLNTTAEKSPYGERSLFTFTGEGVIRRPILASWQAGGFTDKAWPPLDEEGFYEDLCILQLPPLGSFQKSDVNSPGAAQYKNTKKMEKAAKELYGRMLRKKGVYSKQSKHLFDYASGIVEFFGAYDDE